ncbi:KH domain-containing protein [Patescibacteria group bacterium]|nr:KH domain-containing protein [Patescibacteria group bacterium]MBU4162052.1 KH domain-containing protein [Patescibacteria group bacterium]
MFERKLSQKVRKAVQEFFKKTTLETKVEVEEMTDSSMPVLIQMEEPQILIGENGRTLFEIQNLLNKFLRKKFKEEFYIDLDINDYKKKKLDYLKDTAKSYADDVALSRQEKELKPMSAYERRIVHIELKDRSDVKTESIGADPYRKIIIKPV